MTSEQDEPGHHLNQNEPRLENLPYAVRNQCRGVVVVLPARERSYREEEGVI